MAPDLQKRLRLGALLLILLVTAVVGWRWSADQPIPTSNGVSATARPTRSAAAVPVEAPDVHMKALTAPRVKPGEARRNLFTFKPPPTPSAPVGLTPPAPLPVPPGRALPPGPPPIALKFIGIIERTNASERLAVLSDGRGGAPFSGKEGDIIEGRYRILRIGNESIEMAYLDGRGRQTIRLSGS